MSNHPESSFRIQVGEAVAYCERFISRQSHYPNDMAFAQGKVTALHHLEGGGVLADVDWNKRGLPKRVKRQESRQDAGPS